MRKSLLVMLSFLLIISSATIFLFHGDSKKEAKPAVSSNTTSLTPERLKAICLKDSKCYLERVAKVMENEDLSKGLDLFIKTSIITEGFYADCHNLAHLLGQRAFALKGDETLKTHANTCSWGYGHGVMLAAALKYSIPEFASKFKKYCNEDPEPVGCIHGIGHSLQESKAPLKDAITVCHAAGEEIDKRSTYSHMTDKTTVGACIEGWVMQALGSFPYKDMKSPQEAMAICGEITGNDGDICKYMSVRNWVDMGMSVDDRFNRLSKLRDLCNSLKPVNKECGRYLGEAVDDLAVVGTDFSIKNVVQSVTKYCSGTNSDMCTQSFTIFQINRNNGIVNNMQQVCGLLSEPFKLSCKSALATRTSK